MKQKEYEFCLRCGRALKNNEARKIGYGNICYKKMLSTRYIKPLFETKRKHII